MRRHALTNDELQLIREGLERLAREARQAAEAPHMTPEGRRRLNAHLCTISMLSERMQDTQAGRAYPNYQADRARQQAKRFQASLARKRMRRARIGRVGVLPHVVNPALRAALEGGPRAH